MGLIGRIGLFGLLNIDKPVGVTSRAAVNRVQRLVRPNKTGHAGTLDPLASGVLVVAVGDATRLIEYVQRMPKRYEAAFLLGRRSDTLDIQGQVVEMPDAPRPERQEVAAAAMRWVGQVAQTPPAFSALKLHGRRAYDLARQGEPVVLQARRVVVHEIKLLAYEYPVLRLEIACGSGFYVRSLGSDLAKSLGGDAVMSALKRTAIGGFRLDEAIPLDQLSPGMIVERMAPAWRAVADLPKIQLSHEESQSIANGRPVQNRLGQAAGEIAASSPTGELAAILAPHPSGWLWPVKNFRPG